MVKIVGSVEIVGLVDVIVHPPAPNKCCGATWLRYDFKTTNVQCGQCLAVLNSVASPSLNDVTPLKATHDVADLPLA